jgi:hypothetical protein
LTRALPARRGIAIKARATGAWRTIAGGPALQRPRTLSAGHLCALLAVVALLASAAAGEEEEADAPQSAASGSSADVQAELEREKQREVEVLGVARTRLTYPLIASAGFGVLVASRSREIDCVTQCELTGWLASGEAGVGGAEVNFGPAFLIAELGDNRFLTSRRYMGYALRASAMRTWGGYTGRPEREWLGGVEGEFTIVSLNLSLGVYRRIGGPDGDPWLVAGGIGWGF